MKHSLRSFTYFLHAFLSTCVLSFILTFFLVATSVAMTSLR